MSANSSTSSSEQTGPGGTRLYLALVVAGVAVPLILMAVWNAIGDPYLCLSDSDAPKPALATHQRLYKAHRLTEVEADLLILGSSRLLRGIDPTSPHLLAARGRAYNAALNDASIYEVRRYAQHGLALTGARHLLIGLDFYTFHIPFSLNPAFHEDRLAVGPGGRWQPFHGQADLGRVLLTWDATRDSRKAIRVVDRTVGEAEMHFRRTGMGSAAGEDAFVAQSGQYWAFRRKELGYMLTRGLGYFAGRQRPVAVERAWQDLERLLDLVAEEGVSADFVLPPIHARLQEVIHRIAADLPAGPRPWGLAPWKRRLVATFAAARARHPDLDVRLWDFCTCNPYSTETVAAPPVRELSASFLVTRYSELLAPFGLDITVETSLAEHYWEPSHFKPHVGDAMLERIYRHKAGTATDPRAPFGVRLVPDNLAAHLEVQAERRRTYRATHPRVLAEIEADWSLFFTPGRDPQRVLALRQLRNDRADPRYVE